MAKKQPALTTSAGIPVGDNQDSQTAGPRGAADAERDVRGFAIKFRTEEGSLDLVDKNSQKSN